MTKRVVLIDRSQKTPDLRVIKLFLDTILTDYQSKGVSVDVSPAKGEYKFVLTLDSADEKILDSIVGKVRNLGARTLSTSLG